MARKADPQKRDNIIAAAITSFAKKGYAGTRIAEVASTAGIGKGTIYEYFTSKEQLFFATFEYLMADIEGQVAEIALATTGSASERLKTIADTVIEEWLPKLEIYGLVLEFWSATAALPSRRQFRTAFKEGYSQFRQLLASEIQTGVDRGEFKSTIDPEKIASALIGSWDALLFQGWLDPDFDPLTASQEHMDVIIAGLRQPFPIGEQDD